MNKTLPILVCLAVAATASADWTFSAGRAWRPTAKTTFSQPASYEPPAGTYDNGDMALNELAGDGWYAWHGSDFGSIQNETVPAESDYTLQLFRAGGACEETDPDGLRLSLGYDFVKDEAFSFSAAARFSAYWGVCNLASYRDDYRFTGLLVGLYEEPDREMGDAPDAFAGRTFFDEKHRGSVRLRSDLYQIAVGPRATWRLKPWLDLTVGAEAICSVIDNELTIDGKTKGEWTVQLGAGLDVALKGRLTDRLAVFGQLGYEWIGESDVNAPGVNTTTDFSSVVMTIGMELAF